MRAEEILYARQRSFEFLTKPGEGLASVLADDYVTAHNSPMQEGEGREALLQIHRRKHYCLLTIILLSMCLILLKIRKIMEFIRTFCPPKCSQAHRILLDAPIGVEEITDAIGQLKTNKALCMDGLTADVY